MNNPWIIALLVGGFFALAKPAAASTASDGTALSNLQQALVNLQNTLLGKSSSAAKGSNTGNGSPGMASLASGGSSKTAAGTLASGTAAALNSLGGAQIGTYDPGISTTDFLDAQAGAGEFTWTPPTPDSSGDGATVTTSQIDNFYGEDFSSGFDY